MFLSRISPSEEAPFNTYSLSHHDAEVSLLPHLRRIAAQRNLLRGAGEFLIPTTTCAMLRSFTAGPFKQNSLFRVPNKGLNHLHFAWCAAELHNSMPVRFSYSLGWFAVPCNLFLESWVRITVIVISVVRILHSLVKFPRVIFTRKGSY